MDADAALHKALVDLRTALQHYSATTDELLDRLDQTKPRRAVGEAWLDIVDAEGDAEILKRLGRDLVSVMQSASTLRRLQVRALYAEGMPQRQIAELFGVTPQRISQLVDDPE